MSREKMFLIIGLVGGETITTIVGVYMAGNVPWLIQRQVFAGIGLAGVLALAVCVVLVYPGGCSPAVGDDDKKAL